MLGHSRDKVTSEQDMWLRTPPHGIRPMAHLCFPPRVYPQGVGPGSRWKCRLPGKGCHRIWEAKGIQIIGEYPTALVRNDVYLGPQRWLPLLEPGEEITTALQRQIDMYDFRQPITALLEVASSILDAIDPSGSLRAGV